MVLDAFFHAVRQFTFYLDISFFHFFLLGGLQIQVVYTMMYQKYGECEIVLFSSKLAILYNFDYYWSFISFA